MNMKNGLSGLKYVVWAMLSMGLALSAGAVEPNEAVASVTTNGVTTVYGTLTDAWADATSVTDKDADVLVTLLKDATVVETLVRLSPGRLTLDLNDKVLAYAGASDACVISQQGGDSMHVIDTATTRTPRYFTCDAATGLWTLTNEVADHVVSGGLLTGGRAGAVSIMYGSGPHSISNVNFVGNRSASNGGAVSTTSTAYKLQIAGSVFLGNVASTNGGAILAAGPCEMTGCRVEANVAGELGGGLYLRMRGSLVGTEVIGNTAGTGGGVYLTYSPGGCFPAGVKILLADGAEKKVEDIVRGDVVATFDHVGGTNSSAAVFSIYRGTEPLQTFTLTFVSDATNCQLPATNYLSIADRHDLLLETTRKYVTVSSDNARQFVGLRFYNYVTGGWDELTGVTAAKGSEAHYSIYTRAHGNCVANGMLTVPDDKDCFVNVYELDENLKADAEQLAADVVTYGLATTADYPNVPPDEFAAHNMRYARIAIGKGLTTQERILYWNEFDYGPVAQNAPVAVPKLTMSAVPKLLTFGSGTAIPAPSDACLQVGEDTVVTGNVTAAGKTSNVYLMPGKGKTPVIDILPDAANLDVGVTLSTGVGVFGWTNLVNHAAFFFSDNPSYAVSYTADRVLALRAGIQVGDDAWAQITDGMCAVSGTGDMWNIENWPSGTNPLAAYKEAITNVVVASGVTGVGSQFFQGFWNLLDVTLETSVTNIGSRAFKKCFCLTNVTSQATGSVTLSDYAFVSCNSLEKMTFAGNPSFGTQSYTLMAGIYMKDGGIPVVYTIPEITTGGLSQHLMGKKALADEGWDDVTGLTDEQRKEYHFFKVEVR